MDKAQKDAMEILRPTDCLHCHYEETLCIYGKQSAKLKRDIGRMPSVPVWCRYEEYEQNVLVSERYIFQNMIEQMIRKDMRKEIREKLYGEKT